MQRRFIENNKIIFSKEEWLDLLSKHNRDYVIDILSDYIDDHKISIPLRDISKEDAYVAFENLKSLDTNELLRRGDIYYRYEYDYGIGDYYIKSSLLGNDASNYFHQENRYKCDTVNNPSPFRTWYDKKLRRSYLRSLITLKYPQIDYNTLREGLSSGRSISSQFKPSVAKTIYDLFKSKNVLDFSMGWGDRLCGFHASEFTEYYMGIDPNKKLHKKYKDQDLFYNTSKCTEFICAAAEDIEYPENTFDLIFTSPPYYIMERYSTDDTQSWVRYKKLNSWLDSFLFSTLKKTWNSLKKGGFLVINISDVYVHHRINKICDPMNIFIASLDGSEFLESLGMQLSFRVGSKNKKDGTFCEPLWIWRKN